MVFGMISRLKGAAIAIASEDSPPPPPSDLNCSTKMMDSLMRSFNKRIGLGSLLLISYGSFIAMSIILIVDDGDNDFFLTQWSNVKRFLRGIWTKDVDWRNLPPEMWGEIGKRMVNRLEIVSFRSVCKKWRSSLPSPTGRFPLLLPPPPSCDPEFCNMPYAISELTIYRYSSWAWPKMQVDQGGIFSAASFSRYGDKADFDEASLLAPPVRLRTYNSLYKWRGYDGPPLQLMHHLSLFAKAYYPCEALYSHARFEREYNKFPKKLVLISTSDAAGVDPSYARMCDLSVVAHLVGEMKGRLALLRLEGSPEKWVWDTDFCTQVFVNIATYKGQLCMLDQLGRVFLMDYNSLKLTLLCDPSYVPPKLEEMSLFESCGDLYLVDFKLRSKDAAQAYKLSLSSQMWLPVGVDSVMGGLYYVSTFLL